MSTPTPSWSVVTRRDPRRARRYAVDGATLRVSWLGLNGSLFVVQRARVANVSEDGIEVELPEAAQLLSRVKLQGDQYNLLGEGTVRFCRRTTARYLVGIEFVDGLRWRPPDDSVPEPIPLTGPAAQAS
jgi:hypothetical protein